MLQIIFKNTIETIKPKKIIISSIRYYNGYYILSISYTSASDVQLTLL